FSSRRRHTRCLSDWSSDGCSSDLGKEESIDIPWRDFGKFRSQARTWFCSHEWVRVGQRGGLLVNRFDYPRVAVADVDTHQLTIRSEERRVGKEGGSGWWRSGERKK